MIDEIFSYATPGNVVDLMGSSTRLQSSARCRVRVYGNVVIASELIDNPGMSITNAAASIAMQVAQYYEIPLQDLVWVEHYPSQANHEETFDLVHFKVGDGLLFLNRWQRLATEEVSKLVGVSLS